MFDCERHDKEETALTSGKILVIEDEQDIAELLAYNLERDGFRVESALTGEDGLIKARTAPPDLILLDIMLPEADSRMAQVGKEN